MSKLEKMLDEGEPTPLLEKTYDDDSVIVTKSGIKELRPTPNNAITLILQWLTYVLWGGTAIALTWLSTAVFTYLFSQHQATSDMYAYGVSNGATDIIYPMSAAIVLLLMALVCDFFYKGRETLHKSSVSMVIMVVHAVGATLFSVGSLIVAVFMGIQLLANITSSSDIGTKATLFASLISLVLWVFVTVRILRPAKLKFCPYGLWTLMSLATIGLVITAWVGPLAKEASLRNDRLIENNLSELSSSIIAFTAKHQVLPSNLTELSDLSATAKELVTKNLVEFIPGKEFTPDAYDKTISTDIYPPLTSTKAFEYDLCVTYKEKQWLSAGYSYAKDGSTTSTDRQTYPSTYGHDGGRVCYYLATSYSTTYPTPIPLAEPVM